MLIRSTAIWLLTLGALVFTTGRVVAQPAHSGVQYNTPSPSYENGSAPFSEANPGGGHDLSPFKTLGVSPDLDWFAPAETSEYGRGRKGNVGFFFSYERLYWALAAPEKAPIGSTYYNPYFIDSFFPNGPSVDNRFIGATGAWGNRWEVGYTDTDDYGWLVSVLDHVSQGQYRIDNNPALRFLDPNGITDGGVGFPLKADTSVKTIFDVGPTPAIPAELRMKNLLQLNGVELTRFYRARRLHSGTYFELLYGVRWLQINDTFMAQADGNGTSSESATFAPPSFLYDSATGVFPTNIYDGSTWSIRTLNNLVGPEIGVRFFKQRQRFTTSLAARFVAAANFQNLQLKTNLGDRTVINQSNINSNYTTFFRGLGSDVQQYVTTFAPVGELRVDVAYNVTRSVGLKVGYTGMVVGNISRASNSIDYDAVNLIGIKQNTNQLFFLNGLSFGVEVNR